MRNLVLSLLSLAILGTFGFCNADRGGREGLGGFGGHEGRGGREGNNEGDGGVGGREGDNEGNGGVEGREGHGDFGGHGDHAFDHELKTNYYANDCPSVEAIVRDIVWSNASVNPSLPAKLLRLHYHDCFVRGCDGSILLDSTPNNPSEKEAIPNLSLSGYDVIDLMKERLEESCPGVVSCADILALAARDAVSFQFQRPMWQVFTGREDGRISRSLEAAAGLPSPFGNFTALLNNFQTNGLDIVDLVTLSGAHTIGITHCSLVAKRLYNFTGKGDTDPSLNPDYVQTLKNICPLPVQPTTTLEMDPGSSTNFDSHYFVALIQKMGAFQSDAALLTDPRSAELVQQFQNPRVFFAQFAQSMIKMGAIGVLTNGEGEIRNNCRVINA